VSAGEFETDAGDDDAEELDLGGLGLGARAGVGSNADVYAELLAILHDNDLDSLEVRIGEETYELVARPERPVAYAGPAASESFEDVLLPPEEFTAGLRGIPPNVRTVTAPIIGVFYRSATPGADPFVEEGDRVEAGQVLCILEAMKLMNEITSDYSGTVRRILPESGALVSLGEELLWIE